MAVTSKIGYLDIKKDCAQLHCNFLEIVLLHAGCQYLYTVCCAISLVSCMQNILVIIRLHI